MNRCLDKLVSNYKIKIEQKTIVELFVFENIHDKIFCEKEDEDCKA